MKRLLVIDDDRVNRTLIEVMMKKDYEVVQAENGIEGLYLFYKQEFDVVIVDLMMPYMNGYDVLKYIKTLNKPTKVIVCTALQENELNHVWFDAILIKPVTRQGVLDAINKNKETI